MSLFVSVQLYRIIVICNFNIGLTLYTWIYNCFFMSSSTITHVYIIDDFV